MTLPMTHSTGLSLVQSDKSTSLARIRGLSLTFAAAMSSGRHSQLPLNICVPLLISSHISLIMTMYGSASSLSAWQ
eukprot:CAMPEP_0114110290 /NCGR_PEP_ID=MMETSP0043_2-20121206/1234_1 /TAXON_ID=464988 /ORGANISM="Hemiselmis andersenii, Strain CCMP644" /LENGTH=75 /DNA_ID=CAMNT_0001202231 /DNA_START=159 /DNA_END=386 /DNA_ORIENTATION=-